jgi:dihydrolipoamide dehydrogenase
MDYGLVVIGSGPGGYHAAIRAAQLGLTVAVVERGPVGGVCLNVGCIPTKALLHVAAALRDGAHASDFGVTFGEPSVDLKQVERWKSGIVAKLSGGVKQLLKGNGVTTLEGTATLTDEHTLEVDGERVTFEKLIVATGSRPIELPGFESDGERIVDSTGALLVAEVPKRFMTLGGSAIGLEFADVYAALGSEVTVVELMDEIVPTADPDVAKELRRSFEKRGVTIKTGTKAVSQRSTDDGVEVTLETKDGASETVTVDKLLVAVGRRPNGAGLGLEGIGVTVDERGFVPVNDHLQTNVPHVYAIGDVARAPLLAHKAMKEGLVAAEHAAGQPSAYDTLVPNVIYTSPELASVGMTEAEAKAAGFEVRVGVFKLAALGRAMTLGVKEGLVKLVGDAETDLLLGFHMVGPGAGDIVSEATLALEMGTTIEDLALTQHAHPTIAEAVMEAAEVAHGKAVHVAPPRKR